MRHAKTRARLKTTMRRSRRPAAVPSGGGRGVIVPLLDDLLEFRAPESCIQVVVPPQDSPARTASSCLREQTAID